MKRGKNPEKRMKKTLKKQKANIIKKRENKPEKKERQTRLFVGFLAVVLLFVIASYLVAESMKKFDYAGLEFKKQRKGNLDFYYVEFPIVDMSGNLVKKSPFYFREDPRNLQRIEINGGKIAVMPNIALSGETETMGCEDSILAATSLFLYLKQAGVNPFVATTNKTIAENFNKTYMSCANPGFNTLVVYELADKTIIEKNGDCYTLKFSDCDIMNVTERFMLGVYAHSRGFEI